MISAHDLGALRSVMLTPPPWVSQAEARAKIMRGDWAELLKQKINDVHVSPFFASQVEKFASTTINVAQLIAGNVAVVYKMGARRLVDDERSQDALRQYYAEASVDAQAPSWNRLSFAAGPVLAVPRVTSHGTGKVETFASDAFEVLADPEDPMGAPPLAAIWKMSAQQPDGAVYEAADGVAYYRIGGHGEVLSALPHDVGVFPGVLMRSRLADPHDPHDIAATDFLAGSTLLVGYFFARLNMRRKQQDANTTTIAGSVENMPKAQALIGGERPLILHTTAGDDVSVDVHDLNMAPDQHIKHINAIMEWTVEQVGIPQSAVTFDTSGKETDSIALNVSADRLATLRAAQVPFFRRAEKELAIKSALVMRAMGHPLRFDIDPQAVMDSFRVEFPDLNRAGDPLAVSQLEDWELSHMLIDEVDLVMRRHPEMTRAQAEAHLQAKIESRSRIAQQLAERNLILDTSSGMLSTPEVFGRMGGRPPANEQGSTP